MVAVFQPDQGPFGGKLTGPQAHQAEQGPEKKRDAEKHAPGADGPPLDTKEQQDAGPGKTGHEQPGKEEVYPPGQVDPPTHPAALVPPPSFPGRLIHVLPVLCCILPRRAPRHQSACCPGSGKFFLEKIPGLIAGRHRIAVFFKHTPESSTLFSVGCSVARVEPCQGSSGSVRSFPGWRPSFVGACPGPQRGSPAGNRRSNAMCPAGRSGTPLTPTGCHSVAQGQARRGRDAALGHCAGKSTDPEGVAQSSLCRVSGHVRRPAAVSHSFLTTCEGMVSGYWDGRGLGASSS